MEKTTNFNGKANQDVQDYIFDRFKKIFHGSDQDVKSPDIYHSGAGKDFGPGFYCTSSYERAGKRANLKKNVNKSPEALIAEYAWDGPLDDLDILIFNEITAEWFKFILQNRKDGKKCTFRHGKDIVFGPVADDDIIQIVDDHIKTYKDHYLDDGPVNKTLNSMKRFEPEYYQIAFCSEKAINRIKYINSTPSTKAANKTQLHSTKHKAFKAF